jgi:hypothetical protein
MKYWTFLFSRADEFLQLKFGVLIELDGAVFRLSKLDRWFEMEGLDLRPATDDRGEPFPLLSAGGALPLEVCVETMSAKSSD